MSDNIILLFHSTDGRDLLSFRRLGNVKPAIFEKLLVFLKREFDIIALREMVEVVSGRKKSDSRLLALTFDDGPKSYAVNAAPLMKSMDIPSTCFLITDCVDDREIYWRYLFNYCIHSGNETVLAELIDRAYGVPVPGDEIISFTRKHFSRDANKRVVEGILKNIITDEEYRKKENDLFLSSADLDKLKREPLVDFGIHTATHPVMTHLSDDEIDVEIRKSLEFYKERIGAGMPMFSIPFGRLHKDYDERTVISAQRQGIEVVLSAYGGDNRQGQPLHNLRRISINEEMLAGGNDSFRKLIDKLSSVPEYEDLEKRLDNAMLSAR